MQLAVAAVTVAGLGTSCGLAGGASQGAADARPLTSLPAHSGSASAGSASPDAGSASPDAGSISAGSTPSATASTRATQPVTDTPKGSTAVNDAAHGFSLTLPPGYTKLTTVKELDKALGAAGSALKLTPAQIEQFRAAMQHNLPLYGVNLRTGSSVNIVVVPANGEPAENLAAEIPSIKSQLASVHATNVKIVKATVAGRPGLRTTATLKTPRLTVNEVQLYTIANDKVYIVTVSGSPIKAADLALVTRSLQFSTPAV
jgi:hypothetical protein